MSPAFWLTTTPAWRTRLTTEALLFGSVTIRWFNAVTPSHVIGPMLIHRIVFGCRSSCRGFAAVTIDVVQSQQVVSAYFTSKQILPFGFAEQCRRRQSMASPALTVSLSANALSSAAWQSVAGVSCSAVVAGYCAEAFLSPVETASTVGSRCA